MSRAYPHPVLAREGWPFIAATLVVAMICTFLWGLAGSFLLWIAFAFVVQFFRDPAREVAGDERTVVCPADGRIVSVGPAHDPWLDRPALRVSIFMNVFNVHSNRSPVDGTVQKTWYHAGSFLNAALDKASVENERNAVWLRTTAGDDVTSVQVAGLIARRILCHVKPGDVLHRGDRYGFIRFGSRVDVYLDPAATACVALGEKVSASSTVLARLPDHG
jgi:phosphatidylserine decarboxylase